jgi:hypothetical protein
MLIESRLQMIQEELLNREYREFFHAINRYGIHNLNRRLDEGRIMDTIKSKMGFIKEVGELLKMDIKDIIEILKNKNVFRFFSEIKWSIKYFNDMMKKGFKMFSEVSSDVKEYISQYRAKHPMIKDDAILRKAHEYIKNHPVPIKASSKHLKYFLIAVAVVAVATGGIAMADSVAVANSALSNMEITASVSQEIINTDVSNSSFNILFIGAAMNILFFIYIWYDLSLSNIKKILEKAMLSTKKALQIRTMKIIRIPKRVIDDYDRNFGYHEFIKKEHKKYQN